MAKVLCPSICPGYWDILNRLGNEARIFLPKEVFNEIVHTEDDLSKWLQQSAIPVHVITGDITRCLQDIYARNPIHYTLVDNTRARSLADPWIIAHAMSQKATVVTKEEKITALNANRIKIPNVCENMGVRCITDFDFINELGIRFTCSLPI